MNHPTCTLNHTLDTIKTHLQNVHLRTIAQTHKVMARAIEQVTALSRVQIKEDTGHDDDLLGQQGVEEVQAVGDVSLGGERGVQRGQVQPDVEGGLGHVLHAEANLMQTLQDVVALFAEVGLQRLHLGADEGGLQHRDGGFLEGHVGATVEVGARRAEGIDELFRSDDPGDTPARQTETLGQTINEEDVWWKKSISR